MTVSSTTTKNSYSGNGSTTEFAYGFKIFDDDDITVIIRTDATGAETTKTKTTHYTVSGVGSASGGNVTFTSGNIPTSAQTVVLIRDTARTQLTDYVANDPFPAESHEDALDKLTLITQELEEELGRSLKLSPTNTITSTEFTVGATDRANKVLSFDASGELSVTQEIGTFKGNWAASTSYAVRDLVKDTSTNNIFLAKTAHTSSGSQPLTTNTDSAKWDLIVDAASATTSATAAASSATAAASSASTASTQASNASTSASTASTQATNSANSATASASSATAASNAQAAAEAALDTFDDRFLGAKSSDPSVDNDGAALIDGALYFDTTNDIMKVYDLTNTQWRQLTLTSTNQTNVNTVAGQISPTNNIATVATGINSGTFSGATTFAETYRVSANAPTTSLDIGDLWFDTTNNLMKVYGSSGFISAGSSVNGTANRFAWTVGTSSGSYDGSLTVFPATYDAGFVDVFLNGVKLLVGTDVTATNGTSVTLASAAVAADIVEIVAYGTFTAATALSLGDNEKIQLGASQDLQIYHSGFNSFIDEVGTGYLQIRASDNITLKSAADELYVNCVNNGAVTLYHNNNQKLATTSFGAQVTGSLAVDTITNATASTDVTIDTNFNILLDAGSNVTAKCAAGDANQALLAYHPTSTSSRTIAKFQSNVGSTQSDQVVIMCDGQVGIGTSAPHDLLHIKGSSGASTDVSIQGGDDTNDIRLFFGGSTSAFNGQIIYEPDVNALEFATAGAEAMRIDSSGNLLVDTTTTVRSASATGVSIEAGGRIFLGRGASSGGFSHLGFVNVNGIVGTVVSSGSSTTYNTSSDYRIKDNVNYNWDATTRLKQLKPARFNFIADADTTVDGFLAHEVQDIVPEAITGEKDAMRDEEYQVSAATGDIYTPAIEAVLDEDGNEVTPAVAEVIHSTDVEQPEELAEGQQWRETTAAVMGTRSVPDYQGIDQSKLVPLLCKTILELESRITAL